MGGLVWRGHGEKLEETVHLNYGCVIAVLVGSDSWHISSGILGLGRGGPAVLSFRRVTCVRCKRRLLRELIFAWLLDESRFYVKIS